MTFFLVISAAVFVIVIVACTVEPIRGQTHAPRLADHPPFGNPPHGVDYDYRFADYEIR